jgi:general secretion pathway protein D
VGSRLGSGLVLGFLLLPIAADAQPGANGAMNRGRQMAPIPAERPIGSPPPIPVRPGGRRVPLPAAAPAPAGPAGGPAGSANVSVDAQGLVNLDFQDVELSTVIDTIAKLTSRNFVYDDRVRGRVTIVSPTPIPIDQAYTVFESVLQVKGFTTVNAPGGVIKIIPVRDAKESSIDTRRSDSAPNTDRFVTRLIPLSYIDAEQISNTLKPLVSKEAALVAYQPTNTLILTDSASNIRRILSILEAIDVETFKEELALIRLQYADASVVADQLGELFGVQVSSTSRISSPIAARIRARPQIPGQPQPGTEANRLGQVHIITDERTNSLLVSASRSTLDSVRDFIRKVDVPVEGGGRIQVYYLKHADAEDLADTLNSLLGGAAPSGPAASAPGAAQLAGAVNDIASGVGTVTADPATNSLLIQASPEGYQALVSVIQQLDIARPQVLVEGLIIEVTVGDSQQLGFNAIIRAIGGDQNLGLSSQTDSATSGLLNSAKQSVGTTSSTGSSTTPITDLASELIPLLAGPGGFVARFALRNGGKDLFRAVIRAAANDNAINVLSAPHILTSDNEEAEILVGDNIPIITSRLQAPTAAATNVNTSLSTSVNVERQDIGVTLRVTPQITEGDTMRLDIFQEITALNPALATTAGFDPNQVGPALSNRRIENSVVVKDGETVVIGGLISDDYTDNLSKVPWLGDIPVLGWLFKSTDKMLTKRNLLVFLTPSVIRTPEDLEKQSIAKREEFRRHSEQSLRSAGEEEHDTYADEPVGILGEPSKSANESPARGAVEALEKRYPLERMLEIERDQAAAKARARAAAAVPGKKTHYIVLGGTFADPGTAKTTLTKLVDGGFDGTLVSSRVGKRVLLQLRVGPYPDLDAAQHAADVMRRAYALAPQVVVESDEEATP